MSSYLKSQWFQRLLLEICILSLTNICNFIIIKTYDKSNYHFVHTLCYLLIFYVSNDNSTSWFIQLLDKMVFWINNKLMYCLEYCIMNLHKHPSASLYMAQIFCYEDKSMFFFFFFNISNFSSTRLYIGIVLTSLVPR